MVCGFGWGGIDYVTAHASEIEVASMSLGGSGSDSACGSNQDTMHEAICQSVAAGVTYVVAAGNESDNAANHVPAAYDEVITVSALADFNGQPGGGAAATCRADVDDTFADFADFGADIDLIAPGVCILSTWKGGAYNTISGTSMATPHVSGAAALYKATHPSASPSPYSTLPPSDLPPPPVFSEVAVGVAAVVAQSAEQPPSCPGRRARHSSPPGRWLNSASEGVDGSAVLGGGLNPPSQRPGSCHGAGKYVQMHDLAVGVLQQS